MNEIDNNSKSFISPADLGFRMPAEWARHSRTLMAWPIREAIWPEPFEEILHTYSDILKKIARFEPVTLVVKPDVSKEAAEFCGTGVEILELKHDDSWMRDNGPTFVRNDRGELLGINWIFNAWGGKYPCGNDNLVAPGLLEHLGVPCLNVPIVMEGGSIHTDGEGTLLTTEECLLNSNRNPHLRKEEIESILKECLNIQKVIWLRKGLYGDDTDGHVDNVACFAKPGAILIQTSSDPGNPNYEISKENLELLGNSADAKGRPFEIVQIEQPGESYYEELYLTLSYINFYFVNGGIVLPQFGGDFADTDRFAKSVLEKIFPEREIVTVNGMPIIRGGGNVHCLTQQMPEGLPARPVWR